LAYGLITPVQVSDKIILPALQLAALDHRAQRLDGEQAGRLRETMQEAFDLCFDTPAEVNESASESSEPPTVCIIPARGGVDRAAADHVARLVRQQTPCRAVVAARSTGLTAISDLGAMEEYRNVYAIVVATVGGVDEKQLRLIARRAVRTFPEAHHFVLAPPRHASQAPEPDNEVDEWRAHATIEPIIAALDYAPRRAEEDAAERLGSEERPRVSETLN
jgi:hypothetical protein